MARRIATIDLGAVGHATPYPNEGFRYLGLGSTADRQRAGESFHSGRELFFPVRRSAFPIAHRITADADEAGLENQQTGLGKGRG